MNKVILNGNLCKEIELRYTTTNTPVVSNTIAVRNDFKNAKGEYESQFINFVAYKQNAEFLNKYAAKGTKVLLDGRLSNRSYVKQDGTKAYITEVIVDKVELLGSKQKEELKPVEQPKQEDPFATFGNSVHIEDNFLV